jgi:RND family efflux transporter MFP subunit
MKKFLHAFKKKKVWIPSAVIVAIVLISLFSGGGAPAGATVAVERGTVVSEVSLTGKVKPAQSVDLAFEKSGRLQAIHVSLGQQVGTEQVLLELDNADARAQVAQAQAQYDSQIARLQEIRRGASVEDLAVSETALTNAYQAAADTLRDAYGSAEDAIRVQTAPLFLYDEETLPQVSFESTNTDAKILAGQYRRQSSLYLDSFRDQVQALSGSDQAGVLEALGDAQKKIKYFLTLFLHLDAALNGAQMDAATFSTYKAYVTAGRAELNTALAAASGKEQAIATARRNLELKKAGATPEEIAYQEAQVANARASVQYAQSQLAKSVIRAPFAGTVTRIPFSRGDIVQPHETAVSLTGTGAYQIEADVTESDIAKIQIGDTAEVTLDAYTDDIVFDAKIVQIDLSETLKDGVPTYKTTLQLAAEDSRIISGMTADIEIVSEQKDGVLFVPTRNIITRDGKRFVKKITDEKKGIWEEIEITTGLRGSDGRTEIISGLQEGEKIVAE